MSLYNQTNTTNFVLEIADAGLTEAFKMNVQMALIPGIHIPPSNLPSGTQGIGRSNLPGSTIEFDPLVVRFLVDRELSSWLEIYKWMLTLNNYSTHKSTAWLPKGQPEAVTLHILNNKKTDIVMSIHYYGAWPSDLTEVEFNYAEDGDPAITSTATFQYKYFEVEIDGKIVQGRPQVDAAALGNIESKLSMHPSMR